MPPKSPLPPVPKPDLAACPPLAKHIHSLESTPNSTETSPSPQTKPSSIEGDPRRTVGPTGRPKTSHTTIERRYRTNLNARITSLRHAVPALRILEKDENQKPRFPEDVVDERGYVDGVKAARKASKASVLGKAAEYIQYVNPFRLWYPLLSFPCSVLKKREIRLRHERAGLRMLINSLVGGPALLREFERAWQQKYGGEEMDEVMDGSDVEGEEGEEDSEDDDDKPRKKAKVAKAPTLKKERAVQEPQTDTGKRKRGRPRKVQPEADSMMALVPEQTSSMPTSEDVSSSGSVQYLLGAFLFFSFFKPSHNPQHHAQEYAPHVHSGSVLTHASGPVHLPGSSWWQDVGASLHLLVPGLLLLLAVSPVISSVIRRLRGSRTTGSGTKELTQALSVSEQQVDEEARLTIQKALRVRGVSGQILQLKPTVDNEYAAQAWQRLAMIELRLGMSTAAW